MMTDTSTLKTEPPPATGQLDSNCVWRGEASIPETGPQSITEDEAARDAVLKERLLKRAVVAALIVAGLLGSLAIFDTIRAPALPASGRIAALPTTPVPAPAPVPEVREEAAAENAVEVASAQQAADTVPERSAAPESPPLQPLPAEKPLTKLATGRLAMLHPAAPTPVPAAAPPAEATREQTRSRPAAPASSATRHAAGHPTAFRPLTQVAERLFGLQLGVFSNPANAEDLRARLEKNGIPAIIEARVRVGPFATRAEAESARLKLKELGIDDGLLVTMKNKSPS